MKTHLFFGLVTIFAFVLILIVAIDFANRDTKKHSIIGLGGNPFVSDMLSYRFFGYCDYLNNHFIFPGTISIAQSSFVYSIKCY